MPTAPRSSRRRVPPSSRAVCSSRMLLSLGYLNGPYPLPSRTAVQVFRVQFLYAAWSMTVMALVAVSVWDALALDSRDTQILGPLPVRARRHRSREGFGAHHVRGGVCRGIESRAGTDPSGVRRLETASRACCRSRRSSRLSSRARRLPQRSGSSWCSGCASCCMPSSGPPGFGRISLIVQGGLVVALVTTLLLIPAFSFRVADQWLTRGADADEPVAANVVRRTSRHDERTHLGAVAAPGPAAASRRIRSARLKRCTRAAVRCCTSSDWRAAGSFLVVLLGSAAAYLWNNRRLPDPPSPRHDRTRSRERHLRRDRPAASRTTAPRSSRLLLHRARARPQRAEPPVDCDSARGRHRGGHCLSAAGGTRVRRWTSRALRLRCWRFRCCLSRHWSWAFVIPFACRQICGPGGSFISCGRTISPRILAGAKTGRGRQAGLAGADGTCCR